MLNLAHIHARGHGRLRTSEDYGELFDQVRETIGTKTFYCHFSGVDHRGGNASHYTQIKKSDLNFEPLAEFIVEDGGWLDITLISDSPLLEHDAMFMLQQIERSKHRQLEQKAREDRRRILAAQQNITPEELIEREKAENEKRIIDEKKVIDDKKAEAEKAVEKAEDAEKAAAEEKKNAKKASKNSTKADDKVETNDDLFASDVDEDLF